MLKEHTFHITVNQLLFVFKKFMRGLIIKTVAMNSFGTGKSENEIIPNKIWLTVFSFKYTYYVNIIH